MNTIQELRDARAVDLNEIDQILDTAKEAQRSLTDDERERHDVLVAGIEGEGGHDELIRAATVADEDALRFSSRDERRQVPVPNINIHGDRGAGSDVTRSLDDMLWATGDTVIGDNGARIPVDQVVMRSSPGEAGTLAPRIAEFRPDDRSVIRSFQETVAEMAIVGMMVDKDANTSSKGFEVARGLRQYEDRWSHIMRAMDTDTASEGTEWIPTGIGASLHEAVRVSGKIAPLFESIQIPTNPWKWPVEGGDLTAYRVGEPTSDTATKVAASTAGTVAPTFDAEIFGARTLWSKSLEADSAIAIAGYQQRKIVQAFVDAEEKAILDGDTDGTHQDTDVDALGTTDARWAWDGLRKKGIAQTVVTNTTCTAAKLAILRAGMGKWGVNPTDLVFIIGVSNYLTLLQDSNLLTVDLYGQNATLLNGEVGRIHGSPVVVSEHVREDLNASGVDDGITATKTYMLCVNRNEWAMGHRMPIDIETNDSIYAETYQRVAVGFRRQDFQSIASAATNDDTAISYNVTP
jgi:hypothetical protein